MRRRIRISRKAKPNEYVIRDDYAEILIDSPKYGIMSTKIDLDDVEKCKHYKWHVSICNKQNYECFYAGANKLDGKSPLLHRFVMNASPDVYIDHRNRDSLDNRKFNLRPCDDSTNSMNSKLYRTNTSGHKGVCRSVGKWMAYIKVRQKHKTLGYFDDFEDAVKCREAAEKKYFGEYNAVL